MIMKKQLLLIIALFIIGANYGQRLTQYTPPSPAGSAGEGYGVNVKMPPSDPNTDVLMSWVLPTQGGTSGNTRCPGNTFRYQRTEYLITPAEMAASGYPAGQTIDGIGFLVATAGASSQTGSFKVYLMNTSNTAYSLGSSWTTAGFTTVSDKAAWTVPIAAGAYTVPFSGGSTFTYTGGGVYVAWEFSNPAGTLGTGAVVASCNYGGPVGILYGQRSSASMPTVLAASNFRPATTFVNNALTDIFSVTNIYTYEKDPIPFGTPNKISVRVQNLDANEALCDITISINSTPPYTATLSGLSLAGNSSDVFEFTGWTPTTMENVNVTATVTPGEMENYLLNNTKTIPVNVNNSTFSYCESPIAHGAYGYGTGAVIWASKYQMTGPGNVTGANIFIYSSTAPNSSVGNTVTAVVLNSAGAIVAESAGLLLTDANVNMFNTFTFATPPTFTNEPFYIGLSTPAAAVAWYPAAYMSEIPQRPGTFYIFDPTGGTPADAPADIKWLIDAQVAPVPAPIPTVAEWGLILLGMALLGIGTLYLLRRG